MIKSDLNLNHVYYFLELARVGNFGRAAMKLGIAQAQLSRQMKLFEKAVGRNLFIRHSKGVSLTSDGLELIEPGTELIRLGRFIRQSSRKQGRDKGFTIGLASCLSPIFFPSLYKELSASFAEQKFSVIEGPDSTLQAKTIAGEIDFSVTFNPPNLIGYDLSLIVETELYYLCSPATTINSQDGTISLRDLESLPLILFTEQHSDRRVLMDIAHKHGIRLNLILEVDAVATLKNLVRSGIGNVISSKIGFQEELVRGNLQAFRLMRPDISMDLKLMSSANLNRNSTHMNIATKMLEVATNVFSLTT